MNTKLLTASAVAGLACAGSAQATTIQDFLVGLAGDAGVLATEALYDFNDLSLSTLTFDLPPAGVSAGDVITGVFTIDSVSVRPLGGGAPLAERDVADFGVEITGVSQFEVASVVGGVITATSAGTFSNADTIIEVYFDDTPDASLIGTTGSAAFASGDFSDGDLFAELGVSGGGSYTFSPTTNPVVSAINPNLDILGGDITDPTLGFTGRVGGTGSIEATGTPGEFTDRLTFTVNATVLPTPTAALGGLLLGGLAIARRRRVIS